MRKSIIPLFLLFTSFFNDNLTARIIETHDISEIESAVIDDSLVLFDVDDTLMMAEIHLSSGSWVGYFWTNATNCTETKSDIIAALMWHVTQHVPVKPVDPNISTLITNLQNNKNIITLAYTARDSTKATDSEENLTSLQLKTINIDFTKTSFPHKFNTHESFCDGIIFSAGELKGPFLLDMLNRIDHKPAKIIFVDDKLKQVMSVDQAMQTIGIPCDCFWYRQAEIVKPEFDPLISIIQLDYLIHHKMHLTDSEAEALKDSYSQKAPEVLLNELVEYYESNLLHN